MLFRIFGVCLFILKRKGFFSSCLSALFALQAKDGTDSDGFEFLFERPQRLLVPVKVRNSFFNKKRSFCFILVVLSRRHIFGCVGSKFPPACTNEELSVSVSDSLISVHASRHFGLHFK